MSLAGYVPKTPTNHGAFATLFKRSKFASFDPQIAQVYTTHGGNAKRGNWGLKRPLPMRRRGAYITVKSVDTLEQQTEWNSAEPQALWMKQWSELKLTPVRGSPSEPTSKTAMNFPYNSMMGEAHYWIVDSDYAPAQKRPESWRGSVLPNINAMSRKQFDSYVEKIRGKRNQFYEYLQSEEGGQGKKAAVGGLSYYQIANSVKKDLHETLARRESEQRRENPASRDVEQVPHRTGGLTYTQFSPLQTYLMTDAQPGRILEELVSTERGQQSGHVAGFAGMTAFVRKGQNAGTEPVDWNADPQGSGVAKFRVDTAILKKTPNVVGLKREGLKAVKFDMSIRAETEARHDRSNVHRPGSRSYIAEEPVPEPTGDRYQARSMTVPRRKVDYSGLEKRASRDQQAPSATLDTLRGLISSKPNGSI